MAVKKTARGREVRARGMEEKSRIDRPGGEWYVLR